MGVPARRRIHGIFGASLLGGVVLFVGAAPPRVWILGVASFLFFLAYPVTGTCNQAIWMSKTAPDVQGRVFAARRMIAWASLPLAYIPAGPLADRVFEPLLVEGGLLAGSVGRIICVGTGRGVGWLFVLCGMGQILAVLVGYLSPRVRNVETELPDFSVAAKPEAAGQS